MPAEAGGKEGEENVKMDRKVIEALKQLDAALEKAGCAACWLAGIKSQYISTLADVMDKRRRLARRRSS